MEIIQTQMLECIQQIQYQHGLQLRATKIRSGELIQISSIVGSLINGAIAPKVMLRSSSMRANLDWA